LRKTVLYIAESLDGFIAAPDGGVGWLTEQHPDGLEEGSYPEFIRTVDTVLMGYTTYHQIVTELSPDKWAYEGMHTYVFTHKEIPDKPGISFTDEAPEDLVERLKEQPGKDIWICGGAETAGQLIRKDRIDCYWITVIPVILGKGIRLFDGENPELQLRFISAESYNGMTDLVYRRR